VGDLLAAEYDCDVRDERAVARAVAAAEPEVVFHLAAQRIVRRSLVDPAATWAVNVLGTANLLLALPDSVGAVVVVTSDKCYRAIESGRAMTEDDALGGKDPTRPPRPPRSSSPPPTGRPSAARSPPPARATSSAAATGPPTGSSPTSPAPPRPANR